MNSKARRLMIRLWDWIDYRIDILPWWIALSLMMIGGALIGSAITYLVMA